MYCINIVLEDKCMTKITTARLDSKNKERFELFCKSIGLTASAAFNLFVKATLREGKIPFELQSDIFYSKGNQERLKKNIDLMKKNRWYNT